MSTAPARNWASMLKEKKAAPAASVPQKAIVAAPTEADAKTAEPVEPSPAAAAATPAEPAKPVEAEAPLLPAETHLPSSISVSAAAEVAAPAVAYCTVGPVSLPETLAKLVQPSEFRFAGTVAPRAPAIAAVPQPIATQPAPATPPAPIAVAPAMTSSSEIRSHPQWMGPQPVHNPPVNYFMPQPHSVMRPYGGELGSVPRYYNAERHFTAAQQQHAQPYHPTYQSPYHNYRGGYGGAAYNPYANMYPSYYPCQGAPYMGGRLQAQQPYYPARNFQQQQQQQQQ